MHRSSGLPRRARATTTSNRLQQNHSQKPERLHRVHKFFTAMPRNNIYFHWRETPAPPENGWQPARLNKTNPAYLYLKDLILRGQIGPTTEAHTLYNTHPDFFIIAPKKFPSFLRRTISKVQQEESMEEELHKSTLPPQKIYLGNLTTIPG